MLRVGLAVVVAIAGAALTGEPPEPEQTVVIFTARDCHDCRRLQFEVLLPYRAARRRAASDDRPSSMARAQLIDLSALGTAGHALSSPVLRLPTVVLMQDGREVDRREGRITQTAFAQLVTRSAE